MEPENILILRTDICTSHIQGGGYFRNQYGGLICHVKVTIPGIGVVRHSQRNNTLPSSARYGRSVWHKELFGMFQHTPQSIRFQAGGKRPILSL